jgi:hypothetical protein
MSMLKLYYYEVNLRSKRKVPQRFVSLLEEISVFIIRK